MADALQTPQFGLSLSARASRRLYTTGRRSHVTRYGSAQEKPQSDRLSRHRVWEIDCPLPSVCPTGLLSTTHRPNLQTIGRTRAWLAGRTSAPKLESDAAPRDGCIQSRHTLPPTMNVDFGNDARNPHFDGGRVGTRLHEIDKTLLYGARRALQ